MMNNLSPKIETIVGDLNDITNMDDMRAAKIGGHIIKQTLDAQAARRQMELDAEFGTYSYHPGFVPVDTYHTTKTVHHHHPGFTHSHTNTHTTHVVRPLY